MKRISLFAVLFVLVSAVWPSLAQSSADMITLNDATPAIDVVITLPADTTGSVTLDLIGASVRLTDANGTTVFNAADARLHGLQLNIAPNSGSHTLTVERLPGLLEAYVRVASLAELTPINASSLVLSKSLSLDQQVSLPLSAERPGDSVMVNIPANTTGVISASFPGSNAMTQTVDSTGLVIASSASGHVDGMNLLLDAGDYQFTLLSNNLTQAVVAGVSVVSANSAGFVVAEAPASAATVSTCNAVITMSSMNLRSGPGTGYSVLGYGYRDQVFAVGGQNPQRNWVLVGTDTGSAWVSRTGVQTEGECGDLTVFNIPLRDAQPAAIIVVPGQQQTITIGAPTTTTSSSNDDHDDDDDDDDDEDEEDEEDEEDHEDEEDDD